MKKNLPTIILIGFSLAVIGVLTYRAVIAQGGLPVDWSLKIPAGKAGVISKDDGTEFGAPLVTFQSDGKVGIGTATPGKKLEIAGTMGFVGGTAPYCIFAQACPTGWVDNGSAGFITSSSCPYTRGGNYSGSWNWCHPKLCCNENVDRDADGWRNEQDCAPDDATIYPGAPRRWNSNVDANCSGTKEYYVYAGPYSYTPASSFCYYGGSVVWKEAGNFTVSGCIQGPWCAGSSNTSIVVWWGGRGCFAETGGCSGCCSSNCGSHWRVYCD